MCGTHAPEGHSKGNPLKPFKTRMCCLQWDNICTPDERRRDKSRHRFGAYTIFYELISIFLYTYVYILVYMIKKIYYFICICAKSSNLQYIFICERRHLLRMNVRVWFVSWINNHMVNNHINNHITKYEIYNSQYIKILKYMKYWRYKKIIFLRLRYLMGSVVVFYPFWRVNANISVFSTLIFLSHTGMFLLWASLVRGTNNRHALFRTCPPPCSRISSIKT